MLKPGQFVRVRGWNKEFEDMYKGIIIGLAKEAPTKEDARISMDLYYVFVLNIKRKARKHRFNLIKITKENMDNYYDL